MLYSAAPLSSDLGTDYDGELPVEDALLDGSLGELSLPADLGETLLADESFTNELACQLEPQSGVWQLVNGRYEVTPEGDALSTLLLDSPLPSHLEVAVTVNANDASLEYASNAMVIFDYHGPTDFKFAGTYVGSDEWLIGHRTSRGWTKDVSTVAASIEALTDYRLQVTVENDSHVSLYADGQLVASHSFSSDVRDGQIGLGTRDSVSRFDDLVVRELIADSTASPATLPLTEDFDDQQADHLQPQSGSWFVREGGYRVVPDSGGDGISTLQLSEAVADDVEVEVTLNAEAVERRTLQQWSDHFRLSGTRRLQVRGGLLRHRGMGHWSSVGDGLGEGCLRQRHPGTLC